MAETVCTVRIDAYRLALLRVARPAGAGVTMTIDGSLDCLPGLILAAHSIVPWQQRRNALSFFAAVPSPAQRHRYLCQRLGAGASILLRACSAKIVASNDGDTAQRLRGEGVGCWRRGAGKIGDGGSILAFVALSRHLAGGAARTKS